MCSVDYYYLASFPPSSSENSIMLLFTNWVSVDKSNFLCCSEQLYYLLVHTWMLILPSKGLSAPSKALVNIVCSYGYNYLRRCRFRSDMLLFISIVRIPMLILMKNKIGIRKYFPVDKWRNKTSKMAELGYGRDWRKKLTIRKLFLAPYTTCFLSYDHKYFKYIMKNWVTKSTVAHHCINILKQIFSDERLVNWFLKKLWDMNLSEV